METYFWYYKKNPDTTFIVPPDKAGTHTMNFVKVSDDNQQNNLINILNLPIA